MSRSRRRWALPHRRPRPVVLAAALLVALGVAAMGGAAARADGPSAGSDRSRQTERAAIVGAGAPSPVRAPAAHRVASALGVLAMASVVIATRWCRLAGGRTGSRPRPIRPFQVPRGPPLGSLV